MSVSPADELMSEALFDLHRSKVREERQRNHAEAALEVTLALQYVAPDAAWAALAPVLLDALDASGMWVLTPNEGTLAVARVQGFLEAWLDWPKIGAFERALAGQRVILGNAMEIGALGAHSAVLGGVVRSAVCVPLALGEQRAVLMASRAEPYAFGPAHSALLGRLSALVAPALAMELAPEPPTLAQAVEAPPRGGPPAALAPNTQTLLGDRDDTLVEAPRFNLGLQSTMADEGAYLRGTARRYEVRSLLGRGGVGSVYEAHDRQTNRVVALKVLHQFVEGQGDPAAEAVARARFERESALTVAIEHPNIVQIFDSGVLPGGQPYLAMERLYGVELTAYQVRQGARTLDHVLPLIIPALEGLGVVHDHGVVHRDLKPSNLFVTAPDSAAPMLRVVDFGLARRVNSVGVTRSGTLVGTTRYMSPEYIQSFSIGPPTDVYQMGLILAEWLMGRPVVTATTDVAALFAHVNGRLDISDAVKHGPIGPAITKALALDPQARFPTASAFADALRRT